MPQYDYQCPVGHDFEVHCSVREHQSVRACPDCGRGANQVIGRTFGFVQRDCHYDSPIDGRPITSWKQRRDDLARNNCQEYDPEMKRDAATYRERKQQELERAMDETVEREIDAMPGAKREKLAAELMSGADLAPERLNLTP